MIFTGRIDGKIFVTYDTRNIEPIAYTNDEGQSWIPLMNKKVYIRQKKYEKPNTKNQHLLSKLNSGVRLTDKEVEDIVKNIDYYGSYINNKGLYNILKNTKTPDFLINNLLKNQNFFKTIDSDSIENLIFYSNIKERDKFIHNIIINFKKMDKIINNKYEILSFNIIVIEYSDDPYKTINLLIEQNITINRLSTSTIEHIFSHSMKTTELIHILFYNKNFINHLNSIDIEAILKYSYNKKETINYIFKNYLNDLSDAQINDFINSYGNKLEAQNIYQNYKSSNIPISS
jgi:hypothetical protein